MGAYAGPVLIRGVVIRSVAALIVLAGVLPARGAAGSPARHTADSVVPPLPTTPAALAADLTRTDAALWTATAAWVRNGPRASAAPPADVVEPAGRQRAIYIVMSAERRLGDATLARLSGRAAADARAAVGARRMLLALSKHSRHVRRVRVRIGSPAPAGALLRDYLEAQRRSHVDWHVLAAVNLVETAFGRLRNDSTAGAQGPMQFEPSTWRTYGRGNVHDPRAAILAAGRFLHAAGAPGDERAALYAYNPSSLYVGAVEAYAGRMRRDPLAFYEYYAWPVRG